MKLAKRSNLGGCVSVRLPQSSQEALERAAEKDGRSVSNLIRLILNDWVETNGLQPVKGKKK